MPYRVTKLELYDLEGRRKYLNTEERSRFYENMKGLEYGEYLFCALIFWTGARFSEVFNLTIGQIDTCEHKIIIESLKKRRKGVFRGIPIPKAFSDELNQYTRYSVMSLWA